MRWPGRSRPPGDRASPGDPAESTGRRQSNVSLATRLSLVALVVTLLSLGVTATVGLLRGNQLADDLAEDRLVAIAASQGDAVELYFRGIEREVAALASSPSTRDAITDLGDAYRELAAEPVDPTLDAELRGYYISDVVPALQSVRGSEAGPTVLAPQGTGGVYLQRYYTVPQPDDDGEPVEPILVVDPGDGSAYSALHPEVHHAFAPISLRSGFDDLLLIDARGDVVVYSASKRTDFATSLDVGPLSGSSLARLIDGVEDDPTSGSSTVADFAAYAPAEDRPVAFVSSPVVDDGALVGHVVAALSIDPLDAVLSIDGEWDGFGVAGSAYLAGTDATMRSTARPYEESPSEYLAESSEPGPGQLTESQRRRIASTETTALVQPVNRSTLALAEEGFGTGAAPNYRGEEVLSAYRPVEVDDLGWVIVAEIPTDELDDPVEQYARNMLIAVAVFVVAVTFFAVRWSTRLMAPVRTIATRLRVVRADPGGDHPSIDDEAEMARSPVEYEELNANVEQMVERLREHQRAVDERSAERTSLMRQFLPAGVARRSEEGDGEVIDHTANASVVVLVLDGLGDTSQRTRDRERGLLADIVDETDALAADFGLERVKITGGMYVAVCGANRPYLDHAPRSVSFALAVRDLVDELSAGRLSVRGGVDDGTVSVGLTGRSGLLYDAWGTAVESAEELAHRSGAGAVTVSAGVRRQLPNEFVIAEVPDAADEPAVVIDRVSEEARS